MLKSLSWPPTRSSDVMGWQPKSSIVIPTPCDAEMVDISLAVNLVER